MAKTFDFVETDAAKIYTKVLNSLMNNVGEPLYPGDERRIFGDALAAVMVALHNEFNDKMKQRTLQYARGNVLDAIGDRYDVERATPACASAIFRFAVDAVRNENIIINAGTKLTTDGTIYFATDSIAILQAGKTYVDVPASCTMSGTAYNGFGVGTIATLVDLIPYIASAKNITVSSGGDDGEPYTEAGDQHYRERIRLAPASKSTAGPESGYRYFALSADPDIADIAIDSPDANIINIYPLMVGGVLPDEATINKIAAACNADDVRPMTDLVSVMVPETVSFDIELKYYCTIENEADTIKAVESDGGAIDKYIEWQISGLGRNINPDQLRKLVLFPNWDSSLIGADRVDVVKPSFLELKKSQVATFSGNLTVTHEVMR